MAVAATLRRAVGITSTVDGFRYRYLWINRTWDASAVGTIDGVGFTASTAEISTVHYMEKYCSE